MTKLLYVVSCCLLCVSLIRLLLQILVELTSWCILKNKVNLLVVPEEAVKSKNIIVPQVRLDLDFSP